MSAAASNSRDLEVFRPEIHTLRPYPVPYSGAAHRPMRRFGSSVESHGHCATFYSAVGVNFYDWNFNPSKTTGARCVSIRTYRGFRQGSSAIWIGGIAEPPRREAIGAAIRTWEMADACEFPGGCSAKCADPNPRRPNRLAPWGLLAPHFSTSAANSHALRF